MGPRHDLSIYACKKAGLAPELLFSMGPSPHRCFLQAYSDFWTKSLWDPDLTSRFVHVIQRDKQQNYLSVWVPKTSLYGSQPSSVVLCIKTPTLEPKLYVSMGPGLHLWFCACKTECLASELLVPMGPVLICGFCMQNNDFWTRITSLYGSQTWPVDLCMQKSVISTRITILYGSQPSSMFFAGMQRLLDQNYKSLWDPDLTSRFVYVIQRD